MSLKRFVMSKLTYSNSSSRQNVKLSVKKYPGTKQHSISTTQFENQEKYFHSAKSSVPNVQDLL